MNKIDKELDKFEELQQEYKAMIFLNADKDLLKKQLQTIQKQANKLNNIIETSSNE